MMKGIGRCALVLALLVAAVVAVIGLFLRFAGRWLAIADAPQPAAAIVVLSGEPSRALYAAELFERKLAPVIYITRPALALYQRMLRRLEIPFPTQEELYREVLLRRGVPPARIRFLGEALLSTVDEANAVRALPIGNGETVLVVTSPYHVRRAKIVFGAVAPELRWIVVANPHEPYPERWWTDQDVARNVLLETVKIAYFIAGGRFSSAPVAWEPK